MGITIDPDNFPWDRRVISTSPHSEGAKGAISGRGWSDLGVYITWDVRAGINPGLASQTWHNVDDLEWLVESAEKSESEGVVGTTIGIEGWTIVHRARQKHYDDRFYGQFLGTREGNTGNAEWIVGRMYPGSSTDDGFRDGEWDYSKRFAGPRSTDSADAALKAYVEMSYDTFVWDRVFEQRVGEVIDQYWAGPEVVGAPQLAAGWQESDSGHRNPARGHTILLPFHEAKGKLLHFLRSTEPNAKAHLTRDITVDRHGAVELVTKATGPIRFEYGYNTYWLAEDAS